MKLDNSLYIFTAPLKGTLIADVNVTYFGSTDSHGTWLAGEDGLYLLVPGPKLRKVSDVTGGNVAGPCI